MLGRLGICIALMVLAPFTLSCAKLDEAPTENKGKTLTLEKLEPLDSIPLEWGGLVSVSSAHGITNWLQLWFQDGDGNIRMAVYNIETNQLGGHARLINRR